MAAWADIRAAALTLPGARETDHADERAFKVGRKGFVHAWKGRVLMKLEKHHQELLFEARPDVFTPMNSGAMRWSWVDIDRLGPDELAELVCEAWRQVVSKKTSRTLASG